MKEIWAIIRREKYAETKRALDKVGCGAMSVHSVWGRGKQGGFIMSEAESELALYATSAPKLVPTPSYLVAEGATITKPVVYVPKKLLVMVLPDDKVENLVKESVAQLAEQWTVDPRVAGSTPVALPMLYSFKCC